MTVEEGIERLASIIEASAKLSPSEVDYRIDELIRQATETLTDEEISELQRRALEMHDQVSRNHLIEEGRTIPGNDPSRPN